MGPCVGPAGINFLVWTRGKAPEAPATLRYKSENSSFWTVLYQASNPD